MPFAVVWRKPVLFRRDPDLQKVNGFGVGGVELRMGDARAGAHQLDLARLEPAAVAHAVLVFERAVDDIAEDLHVPVRMTWESAFWRDAVFIDHAQAAKAHVLRIVVVRKTETVTRIKPAVIGMTAIGRAPNIEFHRNA